MLDGTTKSRLTPEAMRELCRRSVAGGLAQFMILVFALSVTSGLRDHPKIFLPASNVNYLNTGCEFTCVYHYDIAKLPVGFGGSMNSPFK